MARKPYTCTNQKVISYPRSDAGSSLTVAIVGTTGFFKQPHGRQGKAVDFMLGIQELIDGHADTINSFGHQTMPHRARQYRRNSMSIGAVSSTS